MSSLPTVCFAVPAECRPGVCPWADASVVLSSVPRPVLPASVPLSVPQRDEGLPGQSGRPGHRVEQFRGCVRWKKKYLWKKCFCRTMQRHRVQKDASLSHGVRNGRFAQLSILLIHTSPPFSCSSCRRSVPGLGEARGPIQHGAGGRLHLGQSVRGHHAHAGEQRQHFHKGKREGLFLPITGLNRRLVVLPRYFQVF